MTGTYGAPAALGRARAAGNFGSVASADGNAVALVAGHYWHRVLEFVFVELGRV